MKYQELTDELVKKNKKRFSYKLAKLINHILNWKPKIKFLGEEFPNEPILFLTNHVGKKAPVKIELYYPRDFRMWGTYEMTEGLKAVHKYLRTTYYHNKHHLPKWFACVVATIAAPFANMFYKGMRLIPTYPDYRFLSTTKMTIKAYEQGKDIVIFPEDSSTGYKDKLEYFFSGFVSFLETMYRRGKDIPVFVSYYAKKKNTFFINNKLMYSEIKAKFGSDFNAIAEGLRDIMNSLMDKFNVPS